MRTVTIFSALLYCFVASAQGQKIDSSEINIAVKKATIDGTIYTPVSEQKPPIVLIIAGSGPTDRNGNSLALPGKNNCLCRAARRSPHPLQFAVRDHIKAAAQLR